MNNKPEHTAHLHYEQNHILHRSKEVPDVELRTTYLHNHIYIYIHIYVCVPVQTMSLDSVCMNVLLSFQSTRTSPFCKRQGNNK